MCNMVHTGSKPIPKHGKAWKLVNATKSLETMCSSHPSTMRTEGYRRSRDGWIRYLRNERRYGFCAIPTRAEAQRLKRMWERKVETKVRLIRIEYANGMGEHLEGGIVHGDLFRTLIIGAFRPI